MKRIEKWIIWKLKRTKRKQTKKNPNRKTNRFRQTAQASCARFLIVDCCNWFRHLWIHTYTQFTSHTRMWPIRRIYRREKKTDLINQQITVSPDLAPTDTTADIQNTEERVCDLLPIIHLYSAHVLLCLCVNVRDEAMMTDETKNGRKKII